MHFTFFPMKETVNAAKQWGARASCVSVNTVQSILLEISDILIVFVGLFKNASEKKDWYSRLPVTYFE